MTGHSAAALGLHQRAKELANTGDFSAAETLLTRALSLAADVVTHSLVDGTLAFVEGEQGHVPAARERCRLALSRPDLPTHSRGVLIGQLGYVEWLTGNSRTALDLYDEALALVDDESAAQLHLNRGAALLLLGDLSAAHDDFEQGHRGGDAVTAAKCDHNLGYVQLLRGNVVQALRLMDSARGHLITLGPATVATCDVDRAEALAVAGLTREATGILRRTQELLKRTPLWRYLSGVEVRLAALVPPDEGTMLARTASARCEENGNRVEADHARAVALLIQSQGGDPPRPDDLDSVAGRLRAAGRSGTARDLRIRAAGLRGETPEPVDRAAPLTTHLLAGEVGTTVALMQGATTRALQQANTAIAELEEWQRSIGSLELQDSTLTLGGNVIRLGQRAALASGDPEALLEWSERAREVASRGIPTRPPDELGDLLAQLRHLGPEGDPEQRAHLIEQIRHGRWHAEGSVEPAVALTLDRLRAAVGTARFVSILCIEEQVVALAVESDDVAVHRLGPWEHLESLLDGLTADLAVAAQSTAAIVRRSLAERLAAIDAILSPAFAGAADVVLTVPDELARVPWGQLASLRDVAVALPVSATAWVQVSQQPPTPPRSVAVVVGPETHTGKGEADANIDAWSHHATARLLPEATCDQVRDLASEVDVLHVSAHGHDRDGHRLFAATELHDGPWFGHDIELLPRVPDIVVLSACGVGGGSLGMARAWLHAGARHVIAAPADISERAAADRFPRLHALLADGVTPERAVAEAFGPDALDCAVQCYGPPPLSG